MLINTLEFITFVAAVLYIVFGGADYGAGILELLTKHKMKNIDKEIEGIVNKAIGPVWEANHIWLILIIVILFSGFPSLYLTLTTYLHVPTVALLLGIVFRGVAFTFRQYDVFPGRPIRLYNWIFALSSLWTSLWIGIIAGAAILGRIDPGADNLYMLYFHPWLNFFCLSVGIFTASVFTYLATSFLVGETNHSLMRKYFLQRARISNIAVIVSGALVFLMSWYEGFPFIENFFTNSSALGMMMLATVFWIMQEINRNILTFLVRRILVVGQVVFILLGLLFVQYPTVILTTDGALTMANTATHEAVLFQLVLALIIGLIIILPSLFILFWIFKFKGKWQGA